MLSKQIGRLYQASWFGGNKYPTEPTSGGNECFLAV